MDRRNMVKAMGLAAMVPMVAAADAVGQDGGVTEDTVYELRTYHLNEGKLPLILNRFRSKETQLFERAGMHPVAYWTPTEEPLAGRTLVYIVRHKSREAAKESWKKFGADPEWVALKAESEKDGPFVKLHESTFLKLTDFSPKV
jgi:hypothetical protein